MNSTLELYCIPIVALKVEFMSVKTRFNINESIINILNFSFIKVKPCFKNNHCIMQENLSGDF